MSKEQLGKVLDLFGGDFAPEVIEDTEGIDFNKPIKGGYKARVVSLKRYSGSSDKCEGGVYDMYSLNLQVVENIEGDDATNRYLSKTYSNTVGKFQEDAAEGKRRLMNDLFTGDVKYDIVREASTTAEQVIEQIAPQIVDQCVYVRCYKTKAGKQAVRIVKELKTKKVDEVTENADW